MFGDLFAPSHIVLVLIFALLFFGPTKLPELGRALGRTMREFKDGSRGIMNDGENPSQEVAPRQEQLQPVVDIRTDHQGTNGTNRLD
jgi:sec-independent protein translocase protein TatA